MTIHRKKAIAASDRPRTRENRDRGLPASAGRLGLRGGLQSEFDHGGTGLEASNHYPREIAENTGTPC
jgi:hypothetical protein